jgi:AcrR family transcriptional regulator
VRRMAESTTSVARGARLTRSARRAQLLDAALGVFAEQGYHAAAMDDIAESAGVSKPVLYQHFPGKLELYRALLSHYADVMVARVADALETTTDNEQRVRAAIGSYFDFVTGDGQAYRLIFSADLRGEPEVAEVVDAASRRCIDLIADVVAGDSGLDKERARLLAVGLVGLSQMTAQYWLDENGAGGVVSREEAVDLLSQLAWRGLAALPLLPHE